MVSQLNKKLFLVVVLVFYLCAAEASIRLLLFPDFIKVKEPGANGWSSIKYDTNYYNGLIHLKSKAYILYVNSYGSMAEMDTSGILEIEGLDHYAGTINRKTKTNEFLLRELEKVDSKKIPLLSFDRELERCRCFGNIKIMGASNKLYITKEGFKVFWSGKEPDKKYKIQVVNYFGDVLEERYIKWNEPQQIGRSIKEHLRLSDNRVLISIGFDHEYEKVSIELIPEKIYKGYQEFRMQLFQGVNDQTTIMNTLVDFLLYEKYGLYFNSAEKYMAISDALYAKYGTAYESFFPRTQKEWFKSSFLTKVVNKNSIEVIISKGDSIPSFGEIVEVKTYMQDIEYEVGEAKVTKIKGDFIMLEFIQLYSTFVRKDCEIEPGILDDRKGTIIWKR